MMSPFLIFLLTKVASTKGFVLACALVFMGLVTNNTMRTAFLFFATTIGVIVSTTLLKELFQTPRPLYGLIDVTGYAFPSGHASGVIYLGLALYALSRTLPPLMRTSIIICIVSFIIIIGYSRIMYGVHTATQVLAGYGVGAFWGWLFLFLSQPPNTSVHHHKEEK